HAHLAGVSRGMLWFCVLRVLLVLRILRDGKICSSKSKQPNANKAAHVSFHTSSLHSAGFGRQRNHGPLLPFRRLPAAGTMARSCTVIAEPLPARCPSVAASGNSSETGTAQETGVLSVSSLIVFALPWSDRASACRSGRFCSRCSAAWAPLPPGWAG